MKGKNEKKTANNMEKSFPLFIQSQCLHYTFSTFVVHCLQTTATRDPNAKKSIEQSKSTHK